MNVYVEYVVLDNFVIDSLILFLAAKTLKIPTKVWRIVLGGLLGTACAVASVYVIGFWLYMLKFASLALMCVVSVGFGKKLFWHILITLAYTFALGGAIIGIFELLHVNYVADNGAFYELNVPLFVYVSAAALAGFICYSIVVYVSQLKKTAPYLVSVTVTLDKAYKLDGYCDSGNTLSFDGMPVCFVTKTFKGFADYYAKELIRGNVRQVEVITVGGKTCVGAIKGKVAVNGMEKDAYLALPAEKCKTLYNLLLSNEFIV